MLDAGARVSTSRWPRQLVDSRSSKLGPNTAGSSVRSSPAAAPGDVWQPVQPSAANAACTSQVPVGGGSDEEQAAAMMNNSEKLRGVICDRLRDRLRGSVVWLVGMPGTTRHGRTRLKINARFTGRASFHGDLF